MASKLKVGFLGAGKMATALAQGFIKARLVSAAQVIASDPIEGARIAFARETGAKIANSNVEVVKFAEVLFLAVKPGQAAEVLDEIKGLFTAKHLLISIAAGVPISRLEATLGSTARLIRVMPNTPA